MNTPDNPFDFRGDDTDALAPARGIIFGVGLSVAFAAAVVLSFYAGGWVAHQMAQGRMQEAAR